MKISVIVPIYNVSAYIVDCLESIAHQDYHEPFECVLIDDCGSDNSMELVGNYIRNYSGKIDFRILSHEHNQGLSAARNTGIINAKGEYLLFADSDDELCPDCLSKLSAPLKDATYDFVFANYNAICSWTDMNLPTRIKEGSVSGQKNIADCYHWGWFATVWNKLVRRDLVIKESLLFKPGVIHEDELWTFQLACVAKSMYAVNERTYNYYVRGGNSNIMADIKSRRHIDAYCQVAQLMALFMQQANIPHNDNLCKVIEWVKNRSFNLAVSTLSASESYCIYKQLRSIGNEKPNMPSLSFKEKVLYFHDFLPKPLGFIYHYLLQIASDTLVAWRHRNQ